jgi:hypothetical protein
MPRDPPVTAATPSFDVAVTHTDQASVIGMPQPSSVMVSGSGPPRYPVSRAASCSEVSSKVDVEVLRDLGGLGRLGDRGAASAGTRDGRSGGRRRAGGPPRPDGCRWRTTRRRGADGLGAIRVLVVPQDGEQWLALPDPDRRDRPHQLSRQTNTQNPLLLNFTSEGDRRRGSYLQLCLPRASLQL